VLFRSGLEPFADAGEPAFQFGLVDDAAGDQRMRKRDELARGVIAEAELKQRLAVIRERLEA